MRGGIYRFVPIIIALALIASAANASIVIDGDISDWGAFDNYYSDTIGDTTGGTDGRIDIDNVAFLHQDGYYYFAIQVDEEITRFNGEYYIYIDNQDGGKTDNPGIYSDYRLGLWVDQATPDFFSGEWTDFGGGVGAFTFWNTDLAGAVSGNISEWRISDSYIGLDDFTFGVQAVTSEIEDFAPSQELPLDGGVNGPYGSTPEPSTIALFALGMAGLAARRRARRS